MASSAAPQGIKRQDVQAALAKAMELRALHAALLGGAGGNSPATLRLPPAGASPSLSRTSNQFTAEDYPVFTPSYEGKPLPGHHFTHSENQTLSEIWTEIGFEGEAKVDDAVNLDNRTARFSSLDTEHSLSSPIDHFSSRNSCNINHTSICKPAVGSELLHPCGTSNSEEFRNITASNRCNPSSINREADCGHMNQKNVGRPMLSTIPQPPSQSHSKNRGPIFSWLLPKSKKKPKPEMYPYATESEDMSQILKAWGAFSLESLKKELLEANENRDAALAEVSEMRLSLGELKDKLMNLESYCQELKKALQQAALERGVQVLDKPNLSEGMKSISNSRESAMPVSHEVMVEGFLQIVSEARLSVKEFCKTLINQIAEDGGDSIEKLNSLIHPHQMTLSNKHSKGVLYHLEALINQCLYQNFENCIFHKDGAPGSLDPQQDRQENFSAFVALRNLSWNEALHKGTKCYSEELSRFCDQKMSCIISILDRSSPWPEQVLQSFFVSAKCIWLLHLLAFSFGPPLVILRADENRTFDPVYMEDILLGKQGPQTAARVKIMVMPGFYVLDKVLRCKVLCRYRSVP